MDGVDVKKIPRTLRLNQAIQHSEGAMHVLFSHITAALGLQQVEDMAQNGQAAFDRFNRLIEIMAETRLLELEITSGMFGSIFSVDQRAQMSHQIELLKNILKEK